MATPQLIDYHLLMTPDAVVIYPSRRKLTLLICGGAGFVALGIFLLQSTETRQRLSGLASILFFGFCTLYGIAHMVRRTPSLIIHPSGVFIRAVGFLRWDEISGVFSVRIQRQPFLAIDIKDVEGLLSRQSWLKARIMKKYPALEVGR